MKDKVLLMIILPVIGLGAIILELGIVFKGLFVGKNKKVYKTALVNTRSSKAF